MDTGKTYYEILGVCETASMKVISDAFVRQMESLDDCSDTLPDGRDRWMLVEEAAGVLLDTRRRYDYDRVLHPDRFAIHYYKQVSILDPHFEPPRRPAVTTRVPEPNDDDADEISSVLAFLIIGAMIFWFGIRDTRTGRSTGDSSGWLSRNVPSMFTRSVRPVRSAAVYDYGVSPKKQDICFTPRHASFENTPLCGGTEHYEFQISSIDYLRDCTVIHWRYRVRGEEQVKRLLPVHAFTVRAWRSFDRQTSYNAEALSVPVGKDGKVELLPGGWHSIAARYAPMLGSYHISVIAFGFKVDCWEGRNRYELDVEDCKFNDNTEKTR